MLNSAQICTNCAPIFFEFFQKNLETQAELRRTRDQIQRLSFTKEIGCLKDASSIDLSISPQPKNKQNNRHNKEGKSPLTLVTGESALIDRPLSAVINTTMNKSYTPGEKYTRRSVIDFPLKKENTNLLTNISVVTPVTGSISPIERLRDFENQVSKKVDTFKKKLQQEIAKSGQRPTSGKILSTRPKTTGKVLETEVDQQHKSEPKVSMFSPEENRNPRASPIGFHLTPKLQCQDQIDQEFVPVKGEWTVGTSKDRIHTDNTDRVLTPHTKHNIESSIKKVKNSFRDELESIKMKKQGASSPTPAGSNNLHSPFFSPLRASELTTPNAHHHHLRTEDSKKHYSTFIKPHSTPLLDSIMSSPQERIEHAAKSEVIAPHVMSFVGEKSAAKKGSYRSNYYQELFNDPLDHSPSSKLVKTDKAIDFGSSKRGRAQDDLQTIREDAKNQNLHSFSMARSKASIKLDDKLRTEGDAMDDIFEANYDRTRRKKVYDFTKQSKPAAADHQDERWYLPVNVKGGKFYSLGENSAEFRIGETKIIPINNIDHEVNGGTVVYSKISEALKNRFVSPSDSDSDPKVVLEVEAQGSNIQINKNISLYSTVTPVKAIYSDFDI